MFNKFLAAAVLAALSAGASANIVVNGSFESTPTPVTNGNWDTFSSIAGWTTTNGIEVRYNSFGTAFDQNNFAELDTSGNTTITQTLNTVANQVYSLSFWYSDRTGTSADTNGFSFVAGNTTGAFAGADNATSNNVWQHVTETFTATGAQTTLSFTGTGASDSLGTSLDNINVSAVPEPATLALMASGLALLGLSRRRQNRK